MKLTFLLIFLCLMQVSATIYSQTTKFTFKADNKQIVDVLREIENNSKFRFFYLREQVDVERRISITANDATVEQILDELFKGREISYELMNDFLIVLSKSNSVNREASFLKILSTQQRTVTGKVIDTSGQPLPGVSVIIKGTTHGTVTNTEGDYILVNFPEDATLVFSFVGMHTQEVIIGSQSNINITMEEETIGIEEVVAVGYGTQKKINLTGSVSSISIRSLEQKTTATQASQLLSGEVGGLTVTETSGDPGDNAATLRIRGIGTFSGAGNEPLVIVDGIQTSINSVNPNDIASISVLKDAASAAIYGSRAANGVIIIETKEGKEGAMQVRYESYIGKQEAVELPRYLNSWEYAEAYNTAAINMGMSAIYSQEQINKFRSGEDTDNYPNAHHLEDLFNSGNGLQTKHNFTFSGGQPNLRYLVSAGYLRNNGLIIKNYANRYDLRININSQLTENLMLNVNSFGILNDERQPGTTANGLAGDMYQVIRAANTHNATVPGRRSDGSYGLHMTHVAPEAGLDNEGFFNEDNTQLNNRVSFVWDVFSSLKLTGKAGYNLNYNRTKLFGAEIDAGRGNIFGPSQIDVEWRKNAYLLLELLADYEKTLENHYFHVLGGFSQEQSQNDYLGGFRNNFPNNRIHELDAGSPENDTNSGGASAWKLRSYFGRLNYSFLDRYLFEGNIRYDGSSRFAGEHRYGLFPSLSVGWIISEENFFKIPWIQSLKIRGSWGKLGNQQIGTYPYQKVLSFGYNFYPGQKVSPGVRLASLPAYDISWETTEVIDGGLDISMFDGKLSLVVDHYYKKTYDILYNLTVSRVLGMTVGQQNAGEVENRGWDFELTHKNKIGDFSYEISPNFSIVRNKVLALANVEMDINRGLFIGESLDAIYGYKTDGLFVNQEDINNYATQNYAAKPGYIRLMDIDGPNGEPDGKVTAADDRTVLGSRFPPYNYGMGILANYKDFFFYFQAQGMGGHYKRIGGQRLALYNEGNIQEWHWYGRWTEENPDRYAKYPKFVPSYDVPTFENINDYWMNNASFLRIKYIQLGYNLPAKWLNQTFMDQCQLYISGRNIYSFDYYEEGWDPEMGANEAGYSIAYYPPTRLWSFGVNVTF